ncbi:methyl-accepting chemotaxis protein [Dethiosulfatarculus sandiegensis]|uniref:Methyl-accepting chemotaxis protein n=2 Tax=Dethiosulfatarculus sandiegensis TaxID=1429043 RepID=A0A0D2J6A7_9BACT|nr:methyl-accepting chemotaxis protein [Dethiosulfatarculus sandiegensis]
MLEKMNLKIRLLTILSLVFFLSLTSVITFLTYNAQENVGNEAEARCLELADKQAAQLKGVLQVGLDAARTLRDSLVGIKKSGLEFDRRMLDSLIREYVVTNPEFLGVWAGFEPNALDNKDAQFANTDRHDKTGRYIPYWNRGSGQITFQPLGNYTTEGKGDYYLVPLRSGKEKILDPLTYTVAGKEITLVSITIPIKYKGKAIGVAGVDLSLDQCKAMVTKEKPYGTGYVTLITDSGMIVAHPQEDLMGKNISELGLGKQYQEVIKQGKTRLLTHESAVTGEISYLVIAPIPLGDAKQPWSVVVSVPQDAVLAATQKTLHFSIMVALIALLAVSVVVFLVARTVATPIQASVVSLGRSAESVSTASREIASSSQVLANGASEQASALEETSAALEEMSSMTRQNADNADQADNLMKNVSRVVKEAETAMEELKLTVEKINKTSAETAGIIKTVDEIAFQTNLLALNAAVEAARAGEHGAGFAVVAEEVRNLAMRAAEAAKNTADLIEENQVNAQEGSQVLQKTDQAFSQVSGEASKVAELVNEIAAASKEQAEGIDQVTQATSNMDQVTQQVAANAEESAASAEELASQAVNMNKQVLKLAQVAEGKKDHDASPSKPEAPVSDREKGVAQGRVLRGPTQLDRTALPLDEDF